MSKNNLVLPLSFQRALLSLCRRVEKKIYAISQCLNIPLPSELFAFYITWIYGMVGLPLLARSNNAGTQWKLYMLLKWHPNSFSCILIDKIFYLEETIRYFVQLIIYVFSFSLMSFIHLLSDLLCQTSVQWNKSPLKFNLKLA